MRLICVIFTLIIIMHLHFSQKYVDFIKNGKKNLNIHQIVLMDEKSIFTIINRIKISIFLSKWTKNLHISVENEVMTQNICRIVLIYLFS